METKVEDPISFLAAWAEIMERPSMLPPLRVDNFTPDPEKTPLRPISSKEIKKCLPPLSTAAGPDGFRPGDLRAVPTSVVKVLLTLFMLRGRLPVCLSGARTIFVPKKAGASDPGDFRPITISSVLVRLFHKVLAYRLLGTIDFDFRQRAFLPVDGCAENVFSLAGVLYEARRWYRHLHMATLDVAKAFDSVTIDAILEGLRRKGMAEDFVAYIESFYRSATTVLTYSGMTHTFILPVV
ncbi:hypothetical protein V5799_000204 [Amblyomma americanum]|uniref:Reverse transcriptase domain-containing protein n=1 Tax=Amblyomma americanum TaxID=6943 RepID=A0AAQ4D3Q4_AMBAM